ncbi:MAG TPA: hypothetical protein VMZ29_04130 [Candidatus Bathyarchaeia archaeon]|nr:hypothetical protein [Candidatus Bathyarchaeia archaeon]
MSNNVISGTKKDARKKVDDFDIISEAFQELNATDITHSCQLEALNIDPFLFKKQILKLINFNVILLVPETEDQYYFDFENYIYYKVELKKRRFILIVSIVIPSALLILLALAWIIAFI